MVTIDVAKHVAPKYTITGTLVSSTKQLKGRQLDLDAVDQKMPKHWVRPGTTVDPNKVRTKTALNHARFKEFIPHESYDLDGDGGVS